MVYTMGHETLSHPLELVWEGTEKGARAHATHFMLRNYDHVITTAEWNVTVGNAENPNYEDVAG